MPKAHCAHLAGSAYDDIAAVGRVLRTVLARLRHTAGDVAHNVVFHTAPHHHRDDRFHWHVHVVPRVTSVSGFEQGSGVVINIMAPELAAEKLTAG